MESKDFVEYDKLLPYADIEFYAETDYGLRKVIFNSRSCNYLFTDCTHPMQNCYCPSFKRWCYVDQNNMVDLKFSINHFAMQRIGEDILSTVIKKDNWIKRLLKHIK